MPWITPDWPAPANVQALSTTREDGCSQGVYSSANFSLNNGDEAQRVLANRALLQQRLGGSAVQWLQQVHGRDVHRLDAAGAIVEADAVITRTPGQACAVLTADCLPVLICDRKGREVAAVHAGWRGVAQQIVLSTLAEFDAPAQDLMVWLGPAIGASAFEVGPEVVAAMAQTLAAEISRDCYSKVQPGGKYLLDLYQVARLQMQAAGVTNIYGGDYCTYSDAQRFFSYRRDHHCGRMASVIQILT